MLRIRDEQVQVLRESLTENLEDELFADVKKFFEERYTFLGEARTRAAIRNGIKGAAGYGLTSKRGVAQYVTFMFLTGSHFGENPLYPWARKILVADRHVDEATRAHRLYNGIRRYIRAVRNEQRQFVESILLFPETPLPSSSHTLTGATVEEHLVELLETIAPAHFNNAGEENVRALVRLGVESAARYRITTSEGLSIYVSLMFLLGTGFDRDPQFPWAAEALAPRAEDDFDSAALRLREAALIFRRHASASSAQTLHPRG